MGNKQHATCFATNHVVNRFEFLVGLPLFFLTCERFLCFKPFVRPGSIVLTFLLPLFYVSYDLYKFLHRG